MKKFENDDEDCTRTAGLPKIIKIKVGAKIMLTRIIDVSLGLVYGSVGIVKSIQSGNNLRNIESVKITLPSKEEHVIERTRGKFEIIDGTYIIRSQFPICLSYAITIHKSQGLSLKNVVIDAGNRMFQEGQVYVALSRDVSLDGLHLVNFYPSSIKANSLANIDYNRLRKKYGQT